MHTFAYAESLCESAEQWERDGSAARLDPLHGQDVVDLLVGQLLRDSA